MPRYFFDTNDGQETYNDEDGLDLPNDLAGRLAGIHGLRDVVADLIRKNHRERSVTMSARREDGQRIFEVVTSYTIGPLS